MNVNMILTPDRLNEAIKDLEPLHEPTSICYNDGIYATSLERKWGMGLSELGKKIREMKKQLKETK